jgi:hypothetical protein
MCREEISPEMQKVIQELLENDERKGILTSIFIDDRPTKPTMFKDMMKVRDAYRDEKPYLHIHYDSF